MHEPRDGYDKEYIQHSKERERERVRAVSMSSCISELSEPRTHMIIAISSCVDSAVSYTSLFLCRLGSKFILGGLFCHNSARYRAIPIWQRARQRRIWGRERERALSKIWSKCSIRTSHLSEQKCESLFPQRFPSSSLPSACLQTPFPLSLFPSSLVVLFRHWQCMKIGQISGNDSWVV